MTDKIESAGEGEVVPEPKKSPRRLAREVAMQGLYQWRMSGNSVEMIEDNLEQDSEAWARADKPMARMLLRSAATQADALEARYLPYLDRPIGELSPIERAIYDEDSRMLHGFLAGLAAHLVPGGEGWLILSDLAEHLGLRTRAELLQAIEQAGLQVLARLDTRPQHAKALDPTDPLHAARRAEVTSLWRLGVRRNR